MLIKFVGWIFWDIQFLKIFRNDKKGEWIRWKQSIYPRKIFPMETIQYPDIRGGRGRVNHLNHPVCEYDGPRIH